MLEMPLPPVKRVAGKKPKSAQSRPLDLSYWKKSSGGARWVIREVPRDMPIRCTETDKAHLAHGTAREEAFLDDIDATIRLLVQGRMRNPRIQAAALNCFGKRTAIGERWDTRLVILFYEHMNKLRVSRGLPEITSKRIQKTITVIEKIDEKMDGYKLGGRGQKRSKEKKRRPTRKRRKLIADQRRRAKKAAHNVVVEHVKNLGKRFRTIRINANTHDR